MDKMTPDEFAEYDTWRMLIGVVGVLNLEGSTSSWWPEGWER